MSSALEKARDTIDQMRKSARLARVKQEAAAQTDIVIGAAAGAVIGHLERGGKRIPRLISGAPIPAKAQWAIALGLAADKLGMSAENRQHVRKAAVAMATLAGYESAVAGKLVEGK